MTSRKNLVRSLRLDFYVVTGMVLLAIPLILSIQPKHLIVGVLLFFVPTVYLLIRKTKNLRRIFAASFLIGLVYSFSFDFLATYNHAWYIPDHQLMINYRILGILPIDDLIWYMLWVLFLVVFYEHFLETEVSDSVSPNFTTSLLPLLVLTSAVFLVFALAPQWLVFDYAYLYLGLIALSPLIVVCLRRPNLLFKFIKVNIFFFFVYLAHEFIALKLGEWTFPGTYIALIQINNFVLPLEELIFWIILSSSAVLSYYEIYVDDMK